MQKMDRGGQQERFPIRIDPVRLFQNRGRMAKTSASPSDAKAAIDRRKYRRDDWAGVLNSPDSAWHKFET
jgi:hypothetical protein